MILLKGSPHFHAWLIPWRAEATTSGTAYLAADHSCAEAEAVAAAEAIRTALS
jgi:hypothetical protein